MEICKAPLGRGKTCIGLTKGKPKKFTQDTPDEKVVAFVPWILGEFVFCPGVVFHPDLFSFNPSLVSFFFPFSLIPLLLHIRRLKREGPGFTLLQSKDGQAGL